MIIYIDNDYKCYTSSSEDLIAVETNAFDGKCQKFIEGYRFVPAGQTWTREDGEIFTGEMISPFRDYAILAELQAIYEEEQEKQKDMAQALEILGLTTE